MENDSLQTLKLLIFEQARVAIIGYDFLVNGRVISNGCATLKELNVRDGDVLAVQKRNAAPVVVVFNIPQGNNNNNHDNSSGSSSYFSDTMDYSDNEEALGDL